MTPARDGAVVIVENIVRRLAERQHQLGRLLSTEERLRTVLAAGREVATPMFFGVLIITMVYVPILALTGIEGKMFRPMALAVMLCLGAALVLALTLMPVLCSFLLRGHVSERDYWPVRLAQKIYRPVLEWSLGHRGAVLAFALVLLGASAWLFPRLGAEFVPQLDEGSMTAMVARPNRTSLDASLEQARRTDASDAHVASCREKLARLALQRDDLARCLDTLLAAAARCTAFWRIYRQFKMYNDPALNPYLYGRR